MPEGTIRDGSPHPAAAGAGAQFDYAAAFARTLGWITVAEQGRIRGARVAIAGLGGVGGAHAVTLARLGIGAFRLADFDRFELANLNRQTGSGVSTLGRAKADVIAEQVADINPTAEIDLWREGVAPDAADRFLDDVDVFIDGIDFFELGVRRALFARAAARGIPALTAAPLGTGVAWLIFLPGCMSFDDYFGFTEDGGDENYLRFLVGLAPRHLHTGGLVDRSRVDFRERRGPSTPMACMMCAGVAATETMKLLTGRGRVRPAPWFHQFDPFAGHSVTGRSRFGPGNPMRRLKMAIARRMIARPAPPGPVQASGDRPLAERVIDLARWAPSGDNEQPWRFDISSATRFAARFDPPDPSNPYEYGGGRPVWLSDGALIEALDLAANRLGARLDLRTSRVVAEGIDVDCVLTPGAARHIDPLAGFLETRSVDRTAYRSLPMRPGHTARLEAALPEGLTLELFDTAAQKRRCARINSDATVLRMRLGATYPVHARTFRFDTDRPEVGLPIRSVPLDPMTRASLKWALQTPGRSGFMNRHLPGTRLATLQSDVRPGLACAAHFVLRAERPLGDDPLAWVKAGRAMMRFWLTAESLGLVLQPAFAPLSIEHHLRCGTLDFSPSDRRRAERLAARLTNTIGEAESVVFFGRIGYPRPRIDAPRSLRRPLDELLGRPEAV